MDDSCLHKDTFDIKKLNYDNKRQNKILDFGIKAVKYVFVFIGVLLILDLIFQKLGFNNELIKECFSLLKYSLTTVLGFIFASAKNNK